MPNGDQDCTTLLSSTKQAIYAAYELLKQRGAMLICVYPGHEEGKKESQWIDKLFASCHEPYYKVTTGTQTAPYFYLLEKRYAIQFEENMIK